MPGSTVVFSDKNRHEISSSTTGPDGRYQALVPAGQYIVTVKAPAESKMNDIIFSGQIVNADTSRDFTFNTDKTANAVLQKGEPVKNYSVSKVLPVIALGILLITIVGLIMIKIFRKSKYDEQKTV